MRLCTVAFLYLASLQVLEPRHVGQTATTINGVKRARRASNIIIQCCNSLQTSQTCWPSRKRPKAIATITAGGVDVQCPDCPVNWRNHLNWEGHSGSGIEVFCPGCAANWRENLDISTPAKSLFISTKRPSNSTAKHTSSHAPTNGETDGTDATDVNASTTTVKNGGSTNSTKTSLHSNDTSTTHSSTITTISSTVTSSSSTTTKPK